MDHNCRAHTFLYHCGCHRFHSESRRNKYGIRRYDHILYLHPHQGRSNRAMTGVMCPTLTDWRVSCSNSRSRRLVPYHRPEHWPRFLPSFKKIVSNIFWDWVKWLSISLRRCLFWIPIRVRHRCPLLARCGAAFFPGPYADPVIRITWLRLPVYRCSAFFYDFLLLLAHWVRVLSWKILSKCSCLNLWRPKFSY